MSLVAYAASSEDESEQEEQEQRINKSDSETNDQISDDDIFDAPVGAQQIKSGLNLPVPKNKSEVDSTFSLFEVLPPPKIISETKSLFIEEEDDEFLHKKPIPIELPKPVPPTRNLVQITIPSLKDFAEDEQEDKKPSGCKKPSQISSLISMLPRPKSEQSFVKAKESSSPGEPKKTTATCSLVPDVVKNRRSAQNTENVERTIKKKMLLKNKAKPSSLVNVSDSEGSDKEDDFFALTNENNLPEVSAEEIAAMVSKKAAQMEQASTKFASATNNGTHSDEVPQIVETFEEEAQTQKLDKEAIQALMGSQAKRRKVDEVEVIDISSAEVLPNRDEWLRTALASATTYQPTGVLTDEEPAAGTRRKHQITYLAHKAKANEAELQAMWSANRQNRRQTQNKYGF